VPTTRPRTYRVPGDITVTVLPVTPHTRPVHLLRTATRADLYLLLGDTVQPGDNEWDLPTPTGYGGYIGISRTLRDSRRPAVSLARWWHHHGRLHPRLIVLITFQQQPTPDLLEWCEVALIRWAWHDDYALLNTVSSCPGAAARLSSEQISAGTRIVTGLVDLLTRHVLPPEHTAPLHGRPIREGLVAVVRDKGPLTAEEVVAEARALGLPIASHGDPRASARRDLTTREGHGPRRVLQTSVRGPGNRPLTLYYPVTMDVERALYTWRARMGLLTPGPRRMAPTTDA
jgi:hypothetical protein